MNLDPQRPSDWQELTQLTKGQPIVVERVRITEKDIVVEGRFELPQLAQYCSLKDPDSLGDMQVARSLSSAWPQLVVTHLPFDATWIDSIPA